MKEPGAAAETSPIKGSKYYDKGHDMFNPVSKT
jgi:hypothetical protein